MQWRNWRNWGTATALVVTFLVSGIWHGASWGFVIWGGLHGLYLACSVFYKPFQKKLHRAFGIEKTRLLRAWQIFVTFNLVSLAWVFFRSSNLVDAMYIVKNMFNGLNRMMFFLLYAGKFNLIAIVVSTVLLVGVSYNVDKLKMSFQNKAFIRWTLYYALLLSILFLGKFDDSSFLYFKF